VPRTSHSEVVQIPLLGEPEPDVTVADSLAKSEVVQIPLREPEPDVTVADSLAKAEPSQKPLWVTLLHAAALLCCLEAGEAPQK